MCCGKEALVQSSWVGADESIACAARKSAETVYTQGGGGVAVVGVCLHRGGGRSGDA